MTFAPGQSGNPKGRPPKNQALTDELRALLNKKGSDGRTNKQVLAEELFGLVRMGDLDAIKYVYDRLDGKPKQAVEHTGDADAPMAFTIRISNDADD